VGLIGRVTLDGEHWASVEWSENGERLIWLEERRLDKLNSIRRSGESHSDASCG
jgi:hypothetical protein